jgi:ribosomal protein S18 acetylase RimI-like enzyme
MRPLCAIDPMFEVHEASTRAHYSAFHALVARYSSYLKEHGLVPVPSQELAESLEQLSRRYGPPYGAAFLACANDSPIGCVAVHKLDDETAELRRLFVLASHRRLGVGRALLQRATATARRLKYDRLRLSTAPENEQAVSLYRAFGFQTISKYPGADKEDTVFMELPLCAHEP